jgi:hypothetical protein
MKSVLSFCDSLSRPESSNRQSARWATSSPDSNIRIALSVPNKAMPKMPVLRIFFTASPTLLVDLPVSLATTC